MSPPIDPVCKRSSLQSATIAIATDLVGLLLQQEAEEPSPTTNTVQGLLSTAGVVALLGRGLTGPMDAVASPPSSRTEPHSCRTAIFSLAIATAMRLPMEQAIRVVRAAYLHDIGTIAVPNSILFKSGPLEPEERAVMQTHPVVGHELLCRLPALEDVAEIVLAHHERHDGAGYPRGLAGAEIPLEARILAVADALEAIMSWRPHRAARSFTAAQAEIMRESGRQFDPQIAEAFASLPEQLFLLYPFFQ